MAESKRWRDTSWYVHYKDGDGLGGHGQILPAPEIIRDLDDLITTHAKQGRTIDRLWCLQTSIYFLENGFQVVADCDVLDETFPSLLAAFDGLDKHRQQLAKAESSN